MSKKISIKNGVLQVPDNPIIPFITGDGIGPDIWHAAQYVIDNAVKKAYNGSHSIEWNEALAGKKAFDITGSWLPDETIASFREYLVGIKGPLTTPVGTGIRSINVALRQILDMYVCLRPVKYLKGVPSPVKNPELIDMVIFRENSEDIYTGIEFKEGDRDTAEFREYLQNNFPERYKKIRFPLTSGFGIKPVSREATERLVKSAIKYAIDNKRKSVTLVHKGNIMKFTEGSFREWGYATAKKYYSSQDLDNGPWQVIRKNNREIIIKDVIADAFLQQILTRPSEYDVIATLNLNGDYISDALAAQVGGIGIAPGANINYETGVGLFEATHGTAPKYAGQNKVNPSSLILSGEMMLRYLGWSKAADYIIQGITTAISNKAVTYDFARLMENANEVSCSEFGETIVKNML